ncbi:hypothetical protein HGM15179_014650, partial [Zosterops borbonicus]
DVGLLELFKADQDTATPFTFYKTFGGSTHTFEAAAFPGRFLSTAPGPGEELALAPAPNATAFYLHRRDPPCPPEPISVVPNQHLERQRCPLIVGIRGGTQALSCGTGPEPHLHLQDVGLLELFKADQDTATPFTFYKTFGGSTHTFEAAAFPGRFLSTAPGPGEELALAPAPNATAFYLHRR